MRISHITTNLGGGGATMMLLRLATELNATGFENTVICLRKDPECADLFRDSGVKVIEIGMRSNRLFPFSLYSIRKTLRETAPDVVQGWMYHGNAVTALASGSAPVIWNIRHSINSMKDEKPVTRWLIRAGAPFSFLADSIIYCSEVSARQHQDIGYPKDKTIIIPNGFSQDRFRFRSEARSSIRKALNVSEDALIVGNAARYHPMKNQKGLIEAFAKAKGHSNSVLVICGRGIGWDNTELVEVIQRFNIADRVRLVPHIEDMARYYSAFDLYVSSSKWGEAFPNVLGEAMLSGIPCVATDVGDSALVLGDTGMVVPPDDLPALSSAMGSMMTLSDSERRELGRRARRQIIENFSLPVIVEEYATLYRSCYDRAVRQ